MKPVMLILTELLTRSSQKETKMGRLPESEEGKQVVNDLFLKSFPKRLFKKKKKKSFWLVGARKASSVCSTDCKHYPSWQDIEVLGGRLPSVFSCVILYFNVKNISRILFFIYLVSRKFKNIQFRLIQHEMWNSHMSSTSYVTWVDLFMLHS